MPTLANAIKECGRCFETFTIKLNFFRQILLRDAFSGVVCNMAALIHYDDVYISVWLSPVDISDERKRSFIQSAHSATSSYQRAR